MSDTYDAADNSRRCYELALAAIREREIRAGRLQPSPYRPWEWAWAPVVGHFEISIKDEIEELKSSETRVAVSGG